MQTLDPPRDAPADTLEDGSADAGGDRPEWSRIARLARFSFRRWPYVFVVFALCAIGSLYFAALSLNNSVAPLSLATIEGSDSALSAELSREIFQSSLEPGIFMFTSKTLTYDNPDGSQNEKYADTVNDAIKTIQDGAPDFVGGFQSPLSNPIFEKFVSTDKHSILALGSLYGSSATGSPISLANVGLPQIQDAVEAAERQTGLTINYLTPSRLTGALADAATATAKRDFLIAGIPVIIIAIVAVGTIVGAILLFVVPFLSGPLMTLFLGLGAITLLARSLEINVFGIIALALIALALGGDYTVHVFYSYRRRIAEGDDRLDAIAATAEVSGRASIYSALIAAAVVAPILLMPSEVFRSFAWAAIVILLILALVTAVFLPAVIGMLGHLLLIGKLPWKGQDSDPVTWKIAWLPSKSMSYPRTALLIGVLILAILIVPLWSILPLTGSVSLIPEDSPASIDTQAIQDTFVAGVPGATTIIVQSNNAILDSLDDYDLLADFQAKVAKDKDTWFVGGPAQLIGLVEGQLPDAITPTVLELVQQVVNDIVNRDLGSLLALAGELGSGGSNPLESGSGSDDPDAKTQATLDIVNIAIDGIPGIASTAQSLTQGNYSSIQAIPTVDPDSAAALDWVKRVRGYAEDVYGPFSDGDFVSLGRAYVGGVISQSLDVDNAGRSRLPWVLAIAAVILFVLLTITLRSPVAAIIAVICELAILAASYGVLIYVFQWGGWPFADSKVGFIEAEIAILLVAIGFAIATAYTVLLLYRVRASLGIEGPLFRTQMLRHTVATARAGLAGALLLFLVFLLFAFAETILLSQLGVALATIVALDVIILRLVITPAALGLLGKRVWWSPFKTPARRADAILLNEYADLDAGLGQPVRVDTSTHEAYPTDEYTDPGMAEQPPGPQPPAQTSDAYEAPAEQPLPPEQPPTWDTTLDRGTYYPDTATPEAPDMPGTDETSEAEANGGDEAPPAADPPAQGWDPPEQQQ